MLLGDPYRFAFLIERIPEWEKTGWKNGIMFVIINDDVYPKYVRTTTFNSEMPDILLFPQLNLAKIKQHISYMVH